MRHKSDWNPKVDGFKNSYTYDILFSIQSFRRRQK